jgi:hypothetical protein
MQTRDAGPPGAGALGRLSDSDGPVAGTEPERDPRIYPRRANHVAVGFRCPTPLLPSVCRLLACCGLILRSTRTNGPCTEHVNNNQVDLSFSLLFAVGFSFCFGKDQLKSTPAAGGRRRGASGGVCSSALSPAPRGKPGTVRSVWPVSVVGSQNGCLEASERQAGICISHPAGSGLVLGRSCLSFSRTKMPYKGARVSWQIPRSGTFRADKEWQPHKNRALHCICLFDYRTE